MAEPGPMDASVFPFGSEPHNLKRVPIVRIFGSTPAGQKVYPYIYIPYPHQDLSLETLRAYALQLGQTLNKAIALSMKKNPNDTRNNQYVAAIVPIKGVEFYGYSLGYQCYLKIYLLNPSYKQRAIELLQRGGIMATRFQPYEAHIPYTLQFLMDYNLYGMNWIDLDHRPSMPIKFRSPIPEEAKADIHLTPGSNPERKEPIYTKYSVSSQLVSDSYERHSHCELELDAVCGSILNRHFLRERDIHKDLEEAFGLVRDTGDEIVSSDTKLVHSLAAIWEEESRRRASEGRSPTVPSVTQKDIRDAFVPWASESDFRSLLRARIDSTTDSTEAKSKLTKSAQDQIRHLEYLHSAWDAVESLHLEETSPNLAAVTPDRVSSINAATASAQAHVDGSDVVIDEEIVNKVISSEQEDAVDDEDRETGEEKFEIYEADPDQEGDIEKQDFNEDTFEDPEMIEWLALQEEEVMKRRHIDVSYDDDDDDDDSDEDLITLRPRKLDFNAETEKTAQSTGTNKEINGEGHSESSVYEEFDNLDQLDGANDDSDTEGEANEEARADTQWRKVLGLTNPRKRRLDQLQIENVEQESSNVSQPVRRGIRRVRKSTELDLAPSPLDPEDIFGIRGPFPSVHNVLNSQNNVPDKHQVNTNFSQNELNQSSRHADSMPIDSYGELRPEHPLVDLAESQDHQIKSQSEMSVDNINHGPNVSTQISEKSERSRRSIVSEEGEVFTARLNKMWSPKSSEVEATAFRLYPPNANSPTQSKPDNPKPSQASQLSEALKYGLQIDTQSPAMPEYTHHTYTMSPPNAILNNYPDVVYQEPYYSDRRDAPRRPKVYAGQEFRLKTLEPSNYEEMSATGVDIVTLNDTKLSCSKGKQAQEECTIRTWTPASLPPTAYKVNKWLEKDKLKMEKKAAKAEKRREDSHSATRSSAESEQTPIKKIPIYTQIEPPTPQNRYGIKFVHNKSDSIKPIKEHLDLLSLEIHVNTRAHLHPDPLYDAIEIVFWCLQTEDENIQSNGQLPGTRVGMIVCHSTAKQDRLCLPDIDVQYAESEIQLLELLLEKVRYYDPDLLVGYELHNSSWGYVIERCMIKYEINLIEEFSRIKRNDSAAMRSDSWGYRKAAIFRIVGRHLLNVWRIMRSEIDLTSYRYENIAFHLLHTRIPHYSYQTLTNWYKAGSPTLKEKVCRYYLDRVQKNLELLDVSNMISRTTESARTFGIDFYSVITRGSQFKVESMMLRIAKPENFVLISPSRKQVGEMSAAECLPLVMEPISRLYTSPVLVLDFQSLYPSVMIAYNYCYSTCLGKADASKRDFVKKDDLKYGMDMLDIPPDILRLMEEHINVSPTGLMFVKPSIRKSLLAKMLSEILDTRVMVKRTMSEHENDKGLHRLLDARQLGLKFLANVTYGYTSATFSGRMPAVEIADSIVQTGRETLERAIEVINKTEKWKAHVVYGDTDSVFVHLPGRTRDQAFDIGNDIADTITRMNPVPVKLKFEKVYHPCVLVTKKRYVGYKYEARDWKEPQFEAKGIETVRRDGIPATQKMMEKSLRILFETKDVTQVKSYLQDQWMSILSGRVSEQDFVLAQEVRLGEYKEGYESLGARVAMESMKADPRAEPQYGDRIPYVIVARGPNQKLRDRPMTPLAYMSDRQVPNILLLLLRNKYSV
ncbi:DNA polymerase zeta [Umbelopsis sp. WA50703]